MQMQFVKTSCAALAGLPLLLAVAFAPLQAAELEEETDIKFAFYSSAWGENTNDGLRFVALNQTGAPVVLESIEFLKADEEGSPRRIRVEIGLSIPNARYADAELDYIDLLTDNSCVSRTMSENWRLVEISNYTLNPSVRNLIIEDTDSFRIYQCVENVLTTWRDQPSGQRNQQQEWVLYHFETRIER